MLVLGILRRRQQSWCVQLHWTQIPLLHPKLLVNQRCSRVAAEDCSLLPIARYSGKMVGVEVGQEVRGRVVVRHLKAVNDDVR